MPKFAKIPVFRQKKTNSLKKHGILVVISFFIANIIDGRLRMGWCEGNVNGVTFFDASYTRKDESSIFDHAFGKSRRVSIDDKSKTSKNTGGKTMVEKGYENNQVQLYGEIASKFEFSHEVYGEGFYTFDILVDRLSNSKDRIPLMISDRLVDVNADCIGEKIMVTGQFRSYNRHDDRKSRLMLSVFVKDIERMEKPREDVKINQIYMEGYVCKKPVYRKTPLGREIADLLLAVNRSYGKSDYIPCICWGRNAKYASSFEIGGHVKVVGRIQSREYVKKISETQTERRVAYEVSVCNMEMAEDDDEDGVQQDMA